MELESLKNYLHVDYSDDDKYLEELIETSQAFIDVCCGESYKTNEKLVKMADILQKRLIKDMYDNRGYTITENAKEDVITSTILSNLSYGGNSYE